jgi:hypothetical protein
VGIAVISIALAKAARSQIAASRPALARPALARPALARLMLARLMLVAGGSAAVISFLQFVIGMTLAATTHPATAHLLYDGIDRLDGVKMLALAVLGLAGARAAVLPRWLRYTAAALAVAVTASGIVYLLLLQSLAFAAGPALVLLLVFITGSGLVLGTKER